MRRLAFAVLGLALVVGIVLGSACGGAQEEPSVVPPQEEPPVPPEGFHVTVPAEIPQSEEATLRQLALEPADLPPGLELQYEDAGEEEGAIWYLAHYANVEGLSFDDGLTKASGPVTIDVVVFLFDEERSAIGFLTTMQSMSSDDLVQYTQTQSHWPGEDLGLEQEKVEASIIPFARFGDDSLAWQVAETVRQVKTDTEMALIDVSVAIRRGRAVGLVDIGTLNQPPNTADLEALAAKLDERLATAH
jgi:hypothetical protein